jgi:hypothetical protein
MAVDSSRLGSASRDEYWLTTQAQLKSAQKRGDALSVLGVGLLVMLLWQYYEPGDQAVSWAVTIAVVALALVALPQLFVARYKRRISAMRGMNCRHCGYIPHDTEISEIVSTRACSRCHEPLG